MNEAGSGSSSASNARGVARNHPRAPTLRRERVRATDADDVEPGDAVRVVDRRSGWCRGELRAGVEGSPLRDPGRRLVAVRPGDRQPAAGDVQAARCPPRPLHAPLERDRPTPAGECDLADRSRVRLASPRQDSPRPSSLRSDARRHAGRNAGLGERRTFAELRTTAASSLQRLRARRRQALPVGSLLADLERAEQAPLAEADAGRDLRPASAQPRVRRRSTPFFHMPRSAAA